MSGHVRKNESKRVALTMFWDRDVLTFPSIVNAVTLLAEEGYQVDLFLPPGAMNKRFSCVNLALIPYAGLFDLLKKLTKRAWHSRYRAFMAFYANDFVICSLAGMLLRIPVVYYNLEILTDEEIFSGQQKAIKKLEILFHQRAAATVIQDRSRLDLLQRVNKITLDNALFVPNSYIGLYTKESRYLRDVFDIDDKKIIVLYTGGIESWALDADLFRAVETWPEDLVLVLHGWSRGGFIESMWPLLEKNKGRIYISTAFLDEEEYCALVSSADIGLAWYKRSVHPNINTMGLSSGKFAQFLRCGIPVVVPEYLQDMAQISVDNGFGATAAIENDIPTAVSGIMQDYETYKDKACSYFTAHLDYRENFRAVLDLIGSLY